MFLTDGLIAADRRHETIRPTPVSGAATTALLARVLFAGVLVAVVLTELFGPRFAAPLPHEQIFTFGGWDTLSLFATYVLFVTLYAGPRRRFAATVLGILFSILVAGGLALTGEPLRFHFSTLGTGFAAGTLVVLVADIAGSRDGARARAIDALAVCLLIPLGVSLTPFGLWLTEVVDPMTYDGYVFAFERALGIDAEAFVYGQVEAMPWTKPLLRYAYIAVPLAIAALHIVQVRISGASNMLGMFILSTFVAFCLYLVFPVAGPAHVIAAFPEPLARVHNLLPQPIEADPLFPRNCMPSMHTAWALILVFGARSLPRPMRLAAMAFLVLTLIATLSEFGSHWFVDLVVAFPFAVAVHAVFVTALPWRTRARWPAIVIGALLTLAWLVLLRFGSPIWDSAPWLSWPFVVATILTSLVMETTLAWTIRASGGLRSGPEHPRRLLVIRNPIAGRRSRRRFEAVIAELRRLGCPLEIRATATRGDAESWARDARAEDFDAVVAAGGDGTVNEVANGLVGSALPLGIIPLGTANVLALEIGVPRSAPRLAAMLAQGPARQVWPGEAQGRRFLLMAGVGFDAQVVADLNLALKRRVGKLAYAYQIARQLLRNPTHRCHVTCDGVEYEAASAIVMKGRFYGGAFVLAPDSRIDEPFFHLVLFRDGGRAAVLRYMAALALRRMHRRPDIRILRTAAVSLKLSDGAAVQIDGDIAGQLPLAFSIAAAPLQLIYPA